MQVRIGNTLSTPQKINGGSPLGSILGNYLFCITTDQLEQGIDYSKWSATNRDACKWEHQIGLQSHIVPGATRIRNPIVHQQHL